MSNSNSLKINNSTSNVSNFLEKEKLLQNMKNQIEVFQQGN